MALYTVATMFQKSYLVHHVKQAHIKIAYRNYILKLGSRNGCLQNEGDMKRKTILKERPHNYCLENQKESGV